MTTASVRAFKATEPFDPDIIRWIQDAYVRTETASEFRRRLEQMCVIMAVNKGHYYIVRDDGASYGMPGILWISKEDIRRHLAEIEGETCDPHTALERLLCINQWVNYARHVFLYDYPNPDAPDSVRVDDKVEQKDLTEQLELDIVSETGIWFSIAAMHLRLLDNVASMTAPYPTFSAHRSPAAHVNNKHSSFWDLMQESREKFRYDPHYALYHRRWMEGTWPPFIKPALGGRREDHDRGTIHELRKIGQQREDALRLAEYQNAQEYIPSPLVPEKSRHHA